MTDKTVVKDSLCNVHNVGYGQWNHKKGTAKNSTDSTLSNRIPIWTFNRVERSSAQQDGECLSVSLARVGYDWMDRSSSSSFSNGILLSFYFDRLLVNKCTAVSEWRHCMFIYKPAAHSVWNGLIRSKKKQKQKRGILTLWNTVS